MFTSDDRKSPKYLSALMWLLLGLFLMMCAAALGRTDAPEMARNLCPVQAIYCEPMARWLVVPQNLWSRVVPSQLIDGALAGEKYILGILSQGNLAQEESAENYISVALFFAGIASLIGGMLLLLRAVFRTVSGYKTRPAKGQSKKAIALRRWFMRKSPRLRWTLLMLLVALVCLGAAYGITNGNDALCSLVPWLCMYTQRFLVPAVLATVGIILGLVGLVRLVKAFYIRATMPSDGKVKVWFAQDTEILKQEAMRALGLTSKEIIAQPLVIMSEILELEPGLEIDPNDILFKVTNDGTVYFGAYVATIIFFTQRHLAAYQCAYSFIQDEAIDEDTFESHYEDIVVLSTSQKSYTKLDTKDRIKWAEQFNLSFPSGQSVPVWVSSKEIFVITGGSKLPVTDAEKAVSVIRSRLRDIKRTGEVV